MKEQRRTLRMGSDLSVSVALRDATRFVGNLPRLYGWSTSIDGMLSQQASILGNLGVLMRAAKVRCDDLKEDLRDVEAEVYLELRRDGGATKMTETWLAAKARLDPRIQAARDALHEAEVDAGTLEAAHAAVMERSRNIHDFVSIHGSAAEQASEAIVRKGPALEFAPEQDAELAEVFAAPAEASPRRFTFPRRDKK